MQPEGFLAGVRACLPTVLGYLSIGFAAGVVERTSGLSIAEVLLMSVLIYAGSAQFIAAGMFGAGDAGSTIVLTVLFVNLRHLLLSAALSPKFRRLSVVQNVLVGSLLTDETFGVAASVLRDTELTSASWMHGLNITAYLNWIVANGIGACVGQMIANPQSLGLEFALPAMFVGLLVLQLEGRQEAYISVAVAAAAAIISVCLSLVMPGNWDTILAIVLASGVGMGVEAWKSARTSSTLSSGEPL